MRGLKNRKAEENDGVVAKMVEVTGDFAVEKNWHI